MAPISAIGRGGSSPHTRGALTSELGEEGERRIIPAYAGSTYPRHQYSVPT